MIQAVLFIKQVNACFFVFPSDTFLLKYSFALGFQRSCNNAARYSVPLSFLLVPTAFLTCRLFFPELFSFGEIPQYLIYAQMFLNRSMPPLCATIFAARTVSIPFMLMRFFPCFSKSGVNRFTQSLWVFLMRLSSCFFSVIRNVRSFFSSDTILRSRSRLRSCN